MDLVPLTPEMFTVAADDGMTAKERRDLERMLNPKKRGRKPKGERAMTKAEENRQQKERKRKEQIEDIAILDFETDPFDNEAETKVFPFTACLYRRDAEPVVIWDENTESFIDSVVSEIEKLPRRFTVYAHNGGKFDYLFLVHKLRGEVSFKGRGIMAAHIGPHEIRDSFHIIPEKLASYKKDDFDYAKLTPKRRNKHRDEIISYMVNDCKYTLEIVSAFVERHGLKISIGQAAMSAVTAAGYNIEKVTEGTDAFLRNWFFGGRVECLKGKGVFPNQHSDFMLEKDWKLYDVNSMYPAVMANYMHPIGNQYEVRAIGNPKPNDDTIFLKVECENYGAFVAKGEDGETTANIERGVFFVTIWEYQIALKYNLIENVRILMCVDCANRTTFERFVVPRYEGRQTLKAQMGEMKKAMLESTAEFEELRKQDSLIKFELNNAYGKTAQNPRRFREHYLSDYNERPPESEFKCCGEKQATKLGYGKCYICLKVHEDWGDSPTFKNEGKNYAIWSRPLKRLTFNNVGTAASITGAARAVLLEAICNATDPIYCDTDSIICRDLSGVEIHKTNLGAWDIEDEYSRVAIAGKKLYACDKGHDADPKKRYKLRSKGSEIPSFDALVSLLDGEIAEITGLTIKAKGPTIDRRGNQFYMTRTIRATAKQSNMRLLNRLAEKRA